MKIPLGVKILLVLYLGGRTNFSQGTFKNLDFESAILPDLAPGEFGGDVSPDLAIPGWTPYGATVFHNGISIGGPAITVYGPQWEATQILQGNYSLHLNNDFLGLGFAAIAQTGQIPSGVKSLIFLTDPTPALAVTISGQPLSFIRLATTPTSVKWGADISVFAGQTAELRVSAGPGFTGVGIIDAIEFSTMAVPEPPTFVLLIGGLVFLAGTRVRRRIQ